MHAAKTRSMSDVIVRGPKRRPLSFLATRKSSLSTRSVQSVRFPDASPASTAVTPSREPSVVPVPHLELHSNASSLFCPADRHINGVIPAFGAMHRYILSHRPSLR